MPRGRRWNKILRIGWDLDRNVPIFPNDCLEECNYVELVMTEPGDARPAFEADVEKIREGLRYDFNAPELARDILGQGFVLMNSASGLDEFYEVFARGAMVGKVYWDPFAMSWRFRLTYASAKVALERGVVKSFEIEGKIREGMMIRARGFEEGEQVVITKSGEPVGVGYYNKGKIRVVSAFPSLAGKEPFPAKDKPTNIYDVIKANKFRLTKLTSQAKKQIAVMHEKVGKDVVVSFSGGKDSLVSLHLTLSVVEPYILFNDTGIELPETVETVNKVSDRLGVELNVASAGEAFWYAVRKVGPPGRDYRWCCKVTKLVPIARYTRQRWPNGFLNVVGQRAFESLDRAKSPRVWRNKWVPHALSMTPIQDWGQLDVWMYIYDNNLVDLANPLYFKGFPRIGCFMCPACTLSEFELVKKTHPELWAKWEEVLEHWRKRLGLPKEWVELGLWRWALPSTQKQTLAQRTPYAKVDWREEIRGRIHPKVVKYKIDEKEMEIEYNVRVDWAFEEQYSIISKNRKGKKVVTEDAEITVEENKVKVKVRKERGVEQGFDALKLIHRSFLCLNCKSCELWCPTGAIKVEGRPRVDPNKCISCKLCLLECPINDPYVENIVLPYLLNNPKARKRSTKMRKKEEIEYLKKTLGIEEIEVKKEERSAEDLLKFMP